MKKNKIIASATMAFALMLCGCSNYVTKNVRDYAYSYMTSEVQDYTHDVYLACCEGDIYVEVPEWYKEKTVRLAESDKTIWYYVYGIDGKVSNKGWKAVL